MAKVMHGRRGAKQGTPAAEATPAAPPQPLHAHLGLDDQVAVAMYRQLLVARAVDQKAWNLTKAGKARFVIPGQGQEGAQIGSAWTLQPGLDVALPYYRDIGVVLTLGMSPYEVLLAVLARPDDPNSGGRQMPNHWGCRRLNIITGSSPIATQFPHAAGLALASVLRDDGAITMCWFGEAASSKGDFHEGLNFVGIHQLPVVLVCENNGYAISVPTEKQSAVVDVARQAESYGFEGVIVDGNDTLAVYAATKHAAEKARQGGGPTLVECKTYRLLPHTSDDDDRIYRPTEEVEAWKADDKDPLSRMRGYLVDHGLLDGRAADELAATVKDEVEEAAHQALGSPAPVATDALSRVYARPLRAIPRVPDGVADPCPPLVAPSVEEAQANHGGTELSVLDTIHHTLAALMNDDERVLVLGEDVGLLGGVFRATQGLHAKFGDNRVIDTPLAESSIVGIAVGLALAGMRPVAEIQFADFMHSAFDQLVSEAAKIHYRSNGDFCVPLVVRAPWGGGGHRGPYHSQAIEAFYSHVAGLKVIVPSTPADLAGLLREAVEDPDPVLVLEHKKTYRRIKGMVPGGDWRVPIGLADTVIPGDDMTLVTYGLHRHLAAEAVQSLAEEGFKVELIDLRTIAPLDRDTVLESVIRTGRLLVVHEDNISFGVGAEVAAIVAEEAFYDLDAPVRRLAMPDVPAMPYDVTLESALTIGADDIVRAARSLMEE